MGYSPLGSPGTTWLKGDVLKNPVLVMAPEKLGKTPAQVALRRGLQMGHNVLPKSSTESRIKENLEVYDWSIPEDLFSLKSHGCCRMHLIASKQSDSTRETEHKECAMINQALRWHRQTNICPEQIDLDTVNQSIMKSIRSLIISLRTLLSTSSPSFLLKMP